MNFLSEKKLSLLREMVKATHGKAILLVHPYAGRAMDKIYLDSLNKILNQKNVPVIILEAEERVHELGGMLIGNRAKFFILPTIEGSPVLIPAKNKEKADYGQKDLADFLKNAGVKNVFLGGQFSSNRVLHDLREQNLFTVSGAARAVNSERKLRFRNKAYNGRLLTATLGGCVGGTYSSLLEHGPKPRLLSRTINPDRPAYWHAMKRRASIKK